MSNAPGGPDWFEASNGKWYPPAKPKPPEAGWVGPVGWILFLGGFVAAFIAAVTEDGTGTTPNAPLLGFGVVCVLLGLGILAATGRIIPRR